MPFQYVYKDPLPRLSDPHDKDKMVLRPSYLDNGISFPDKMRLYIEKALLFTHCGLVTQYGSIDLGHIGSSSGVLPDGTKPLPKPILTRHKWS